MAEYIGSRITLYSRSDIRYVGTLFEIDPVNSTVSLEKVICFGTEGRRPDEEIPPSDTVYDYVVFRGSDVKDLSVLAPPPGQVQSPDIPGPAPAPQGPTDPAILQWLNNLVDVSTDLRQSGSRPTPASMTAQPQEPQVAQASQAVHESESQTLVSSQPQSQSQQPPPTQGPVANFSSSLPMSMPLGYHPYYPQQPMPLPVPGPHGHVAPPPAQAFPGMPHGPPPGWHPPPGHHPHAGMGRLALDAHQYFLPGPPPYPPPMPIGRQRGGPALNAQQRPEPPITQTPTVAPVALPEPEPAVNKNTNKTAALNRETPMPKPGAPKQQRAPTPPVESKPDLAQALAPVAAGPALAEDTHRITNANKKKPSPVVPAIPVPNLGAKRAPAPTEALQAHAGNAAPSRKAQPSHEAANAALREATQAATAAVAAAMAKLPPAPGQKQGPQVHSAIDDLTRKLDTMRTGDTTQPPRQPSGSGPVRGHRGGGSGDHRGRGRGGHHAPPTRKVEVPAEDYDFESANATFNKQDLIKEAIASGTALPAEPNDQPATNGVADAGEGTTTGARERGVLPVSTYNKATSFFDNISSEAKEREEGHGPRRGGREWRGEEQKRNVETFGQGSVDTGYRGHYRGRGRGRGYGRGRGGFGGRGGGRGGGGRGRFRGDHQAGQPPRAPAVTATT